MKKMPYIVSEIGGNFTTFEKAALMIDQSVECGADAVKLQTYKGETISSKKAMFDMENTGNISQLEYFKSFEIDEGLHREVFAYAREKGIAIFTTPSHKTDVEMLEKIGCERYKVGSDDLSNLPFLRYLAQTKKPIVLATGMGTMKDVHDAVDAITGEGNSRLTLLHAVTAYPTHPEDANLGAMVAMMCEFPNLDVGYSDHTLGTAACIYAAALGAKMIEKHFTYDKNADGPDHMHAAEAADLKYIVDTIRNQVVLYGSGIKMPAASEQSTRKNNRKSVVAAKDMNEGVKLTFECLEVKRPGYGIHPRYLHQLVGRTLSRNVEEDDVLHWEDLA